jgi:hypothetical protein
MENIIVWHGGQPSAIRPEVAQQFGIERTTNLTDNPELYQRIMDAQNAATGAVCTMEEGCGSCGS